MKSRPFFFGPLIEVQKSSNLHRLGRSTGSVALSIGIWAGISNPVFAVDYIKDDNTNLLNSGSSWVGGTGPTSKTDRGLFDSTWSAVNAAAGTTTGSFALGAFVFQNTLNGPVGLTTASGTTVTLGGNAADIIDMSAANQDVTWGGAGTLQLGTLTGTQNFDVGAGRTLNINVATLRAQGNSNTLGLTGTGNISISSNVSSASVIGLNVNGANVTLSGNNTWAPNVTTTFALTSGTLNFGSNNAIQTASGNTKQFTVAGGTITASGAARNVVTNGGFLGSASYAVGGSNNLTLGSNYSNSGSNTITNNMTGGAVFTIGGNIDLTNSGATNRVLTFAGAGASAVSGVISNGTSTGLGSLTYSGSSTLTLASANTYSGNTTISSGAVKIGNANALGLGRTLLASGATLDLNGNNLNTAFIENTASLSGGTIDNVSAGGNVTLTVGSGVGGENAASGTYLTIGSFSGVIKNTTGAVSLTKVAPTTGGVSIMATASRLTGASVLTLTGVNTYTGATTIKGGFIQLLPQGSTAMISSTSPLVLQGGGLVSTNLAGLSVTQTFASTTLNAGASQVSPVRQSSTTNNFNLGAITRNIGSTVNFYDRPAGGSSNQNIGPADGVVNTSTVNTGGILGGYAVVSGNTWAVGGGNISGLGSYSAALTAGTNVDVPGAGLTGGGGGLAVNSLRFLNGTTATTTTPTLGLTGDLVVTTGGILTVGGASGAGNTAVANAQINGNFNLTSGNSQDLIFTTNNLGGSGVAAMTVTSNITNNGGTGIGLTKSGAGTLTLTPATANTFTGQLTLNAGNLILGNSSALNGNDVVFGGSSEFHNVGGLGAVLQNGTLTLNGNSNTAGSLASSIDSSGTAVVRNAGGSAVSNATLTLNGATSASFAGTFIDGTGGGTLGLTKSGSGTQTLTGANTFTGDINIGGGVLAANRSNNSTNPTTSALGNVQVARNINVNNGGTLRFDNGDTFGGAASVIVSTLAINAGGTVTNNGSSYTTLGPVTLNGGTLTGTGGSGSAQFQMYGFGGDVTVGGSSVSTISGSGTTSGYHLGTSATGRTGTTFNVAEATGNSASDLDVSAVLLDRTGGGGAASLTKSGAGTMTLSGTSTYTGATTVSAGTLLVNGVLGNTAVSVTAGTLGGTGAIGGGVTISSGAFLSPGASIESLGVASATINGTLLAEYDGTGLGTIDLLSVAGLLDITNATVDFNQLGSSLDDPFYVFATYGSLGGTQFANVTDLPSGYNINYAYNDGFTSTNIALVAVPEPASLLLGSLGLLAILRRRRN